MELKRNIKLMTWFNFLLDFRFYSPVAIIYFAQVSGSYALGMSIFSVTMLSSALFEVPTGIFSDIIGRKKTIVLGALASLVSVFLYALGSHYWLLVSGAIIEGLARSFYSGNNEAMLHDWLWEDQREQEYAEYLGRTSSMFQWALAFTAVIGGLLASLSFALVMWLSILPAFGCMILAIQMSEPQVKSNSQGNIFIHLTEAINLFKTNRKLRSLSITNAIGFAAGESGYQFQSAFINMLWPVWAIGFAKMLSNIGAALSFHYSGKLIQKFTSLKLLWTGHIYSFIVNVLALVFPTPLSPVIMSSTSVFFGTNTVAMSELQQKEYTQKQRSTMGSLNSLFGNVLFAITAVIVGEMADSYGSVNALLFLRIPAMITTILIWRMFRQKN